MLVLDAALYCTREVLHHKLFVLPQENFFTILSYCLAVAGMIFCFMEFGMLIRYLYRFYHRIDSFILSDLYSAEGVSNLLAQYEVEMVNLEPRFANENKDITKIRKSIRALLLKSMISEGSRKQMYLDDVAKVIKLQEDVTLQNYVARRKNNKRIASEIELTALDIYPKIRKTVQPRLEKMMISGREDRESLLLLKRNSVEPRETLRLGERVNSNEPDKKASDESTGGETDRSANSSASLLTLEQNLSILNIEKRLLSKYFPFVSQNIIEEKVDSVIGLSINLGWLIRFCLVNLMIASGQMVPLIQVSIILICNSVFFVWFMRAYFRKDIFNPGWERRASLMLEITLQIFFMITVVFYMNDNNYVKLSSSTFKALQYICIGLIFLCILFEIIILLGGIFHSIMDMCKRLRQRLIAMKNGKKNTQGLEAKSDEHLSDHEHQRRIDGRSVALKPIPESSLSGGNSNSAGTNSRSAGTNSLSAGTHSSGQPTHTFLL